MTETSERLWQGIQTVCAGADFRSVMQALLDSLTVAIAWSFDTPEEADTFIDELQNDLKREVRESWVLVRDPANQVGTGVGRG